MQRYGSRDAARTNSERTTRVAAFSSRDFAVYWRRLGWRGLAVARGAHARRRWRGGDSQCHSVPGVAAPWPFSLWSAADASVYVNLEQPSSPSLARATAIVSHWRYAIKRGADDRGHVVVHVATVVHSLRHYSTAREHSERSNELLPVHPSNHAIGRVRYGVATDSNAIRFTLDPPLPRSFVLLFHKVPPSFARFSRLDSRSTCGQLELELIAGRFRKTSCRVSREESSSTWSTTTRSLYLHPRDLSGTPLTLHRHGFACSSQPPDPISSSVLRERERQRERVSVTYTLEHRSFLDRNLSSLCRRDRLSSDVPLKKRCWLRSYVRRRNNTTRYCPRSTIYYFASEEKSVQCVRASSSF